MIEPSRLARSPTEFTRQQTEFAGLQKLCLRSFPGRLDQRISQVEPLGGERYPSLALTLSWREGQRARVERLALRRYADPWTWWTFDDRGKAQREWTVVRWLYGLGLPVPTLYAYGTESGESFTLMATVSGRSDPLPKVGQSMGSDPYVDGVASLLARLHHLTPPGAVREVLPNIVVQDELIRIAGIAHRCYDGGLIEAVDELTGEEVEVLPPCVLHGNPERANVLYDARGVTTLLNWENSALGDPRWDVARVVNELRSHQAEDSVGRFCTMYAERADRRLTDMSFWETLAAVQNWAIAIWVRTGINDHRLSSSSVTESLAFQLEAHRTRAQRALTRLRYERLERTARSAQSST